MSTRLLVCGSRSWTDRAAIDQQIRLTRDELEVVIEGEAPGADRLARAVAEAYGVPVLPFPADWKAHGRRAGILRNLAMLREGRPTEVIAFTDDFGLSPRSGTRHMCRIAVAASLPVTLFEHYSLSLEDFIAKRSSGVGLCYPRDLTAEDFAEATRG